MEKALIACDVTIEVFSDMKHKEQKYCEIVILRILVNIGEWCKYYENCEILINIDEW